MDGLATTPAAVRRASLAPLQLGRGASVVRMAVVGLAIAFGLGACSTVQVPAPLPQPPGGLNAVTTVQAPSNVQQFSGRLSLRVHQPRSGATDGGTILFDFEGHSDEGKLVLQTVIGTAVATAKWSPRGAEIVTPRGRHEGAQLDDVATALLGQALPLAAILHWVRAQPWDRAPHEPRAEGFEQLGWSISLEAWHERVVTAHRSARADRPGDLDITVRARLDDPVGAERRNGP